MAYFLLENGSHLQFEDNSGLLLLEFSLIIPGIAVRTIVDTFAGPKELVVLGIDVYSGPSIITGQPIDVFGGPCVIKVK